VSNREGNKDECGEGVLFRKGGERNPVLMAESLESSAAKILREEKKTGGKNTDEKPEFSHWL